MAKPTAEPEQPRVATLSDAIKQLNAQYGWMLPTGDDFAAGSVLHEIWSLQAEITNPPPNALKYQATTASFELAPSLSGRFVLGVELDTTAAEIPLLKSGGR